MFSHVACLVCTAALVAADPTPRDQYKALVKEYDAARTAFLEASQQPQALDKPRPQAPYPDATQFAPRFLALAKQSPDDSAAVDALLWVASQCMFHPQGEQALNTLTARYSDSKAVAEYAAMSSRYGEAFGAYEELLRAVLASNPNRKVQASVTLALATYLKTVKNRAENVLLQSSLPGSRGLAPVTIENLKRLKERGLDSLAAESETLFQRVINEYSDVGILSNYPPQAGKFAKEQLYELRNLSIGSHAPELDAVDVSGQPIKLSELRGKVVLLDFGSHSSCGICRQLYPALRSLVEQFAGQPFALIGVNSLDDLDELKGLVRDKEITWPLVWDGKEIDGPLASQWVIRGMPTFYVLDHEGVIRSKGMLQADELALLVQRLLKDIPRDKP